MILNTPPESDKINNPLISIIIPTYNRKVEISSCIASLSNQSYKHLEIIIIDDGSTDGTVDFIKNNYATIKVIRNEKRCGPSLARNIGIKESKGSLILFIDSDIAFYCDNTLQNMVNAMLAYPDVGSIGGEIPASNSNAEYAYGRSFKRDGKISVEVPIKYLEDSKNFKVCDYLATCNCMVRRDVALKTGGFDPFYIFGAEDMDLGFAINKLGYKNVVGYNYAILHHRSRIGRFKDESIMYHRTGIRFIIKNYGLSSYFMRALNDTGYIILIYLALIPKIIIYRLQRKKLVSDHFFYGVKMIQSHAWNLIHLKETILSREKNFLDSKEISAALDKVQKRVAT